MLRAAILIAALLAAGAAEAQRPFTPRLSCAQAQQLVASRGQIVMSTSPTTYDRFVADHRFCPTSYAAEPAWERTADAAQCFIGFRCELRDRFRRFD
jgi:hypothetical protein